MEAFAQILLYLAIALAILLFFGPIVVITSLIGKFEISKFRIDVTTLGRFGRTVLATVGIFVWFSVYIPLIFFVWFRLPATPTPFMPTPTFTPTSHSPNISASTPTPPIGPPTIQRACSEPQNSEPNIRIRGVAEACGCEASDFSIIKIDNRSIKVTGEWNNRQPKTTLWAFLTEENNNEVLGAPRRVIPDTPGQPDWNIFLFIPEEADGPGKSFHIWLLALNQEATDAFQKDIDDGSPITLPSPPEDQPHQEVLIEHVEVIDNRASICPEES